MGNITSLLFFQNFIGSPPLAWGTLLVSLICHRITPTRVGNTADYCHKKKTLRITPPMWGTLLSSSSLNWAHPHSREEKCKLFSLQAIPLGIPPPAWGKVQVFQTASDTARNTPIYMRKSVSESESLPRKQEHPHPREEYHAWYDVNGDVPGAPPPTWGIQLMNIM